jgi:hypothetical protein
MTASVPRSIERHFRGPGYRAGIAGGRTYRTCRCVVAAYPSDLRLAVWRGNLHENGGNLGACLSIRRISLYTEGRVRFCPWT